MSLVKVQAYQKVSKEMCGRHIFLDITLNRFWIKKFINMRLIKLISTKVRRRLDYECYTDKSFTKLFMVSRFIEAKAFGLFWIQVNRYVIFFNEG